MFATALPTDTQKFMNWTWPQLEPYFKDLTDRSLTAQSVTDWLHDWTALSERIYETYSRLHVARTLNTTDTEAEQRYFTFLTEVLPNVEAAEQKLKQKLLDSRLEPAGFEIPLRNMRAEAEIFREENLPLITQNRKLGSEYDKIIGAQTVQWEGREVTLYQLRPVYQDPDRSRRERARRLAAERQLADRAAINSLWTQLVELRRKIAQQAGFADYRAYRWRELLRFDYTPEDALSFQRAIEQVAVPAATRIYEKRRRQLGVDSLRPWDLDLDLYPVSFSALSPFNNIEELKQKTAEIFQHVDPKLGSYYATMQREALLDLENRKGKAPGGYCTEYPVAKRPFIFMNAVGVRDDVRTMLHESGHAFHVFETAHLPYYQQTQVSMEFAEVASMSMELLASPYLSDRYGGFYSESDAAQDRIDHLERIILFWPYMAVVDAFQHWAHTDPQGGDPDACDQKWTELWRRFLPGVDWSGLDEAMLTGWHRKQHIHRSPFYYIEYGLAQLGAVQVWRNALNDQAGAVANYRKALALGYTVPLPELYQTAGAKFAFDSNTLGEAVALIERVIRDLETK
jgi:oligoendopeptidase F